MEAHLVGHEMEERHLALANRHIEEGQARIERQAELVEQLKARGQSAQRAEAFLRLLEDTLSGWQEQRDLILVELARR
jgi:hypothetical protein